MNRIARELDVNAKRETWQGEDWDKYFIFTNIFRYNLSLYYIYTFSTHKLIFLLEYQPGFIFLYFRNVVSKRCTTIMIPLLESPTRETFESSPKPNATDSILSLTAMNAVVPWRSIHPFTLTGMVERFLTSSVITPLKVIVKTSHEAQSALNSG